MTDASVKKNEGTPPQPGNAVLAAEKETGVAPKTKKKTHGLKGPWMYVGPTAPGIGVQNRVYTEIPKEAEELSEEVKEVGLLFIPVKDYPMANRMLREGVGYLYDAYCKVGGLKKGDFEA